MHGIQKLTYLQMKIIQKVLKAFILAEIILMLSVTGFLLLDLSLKDLPGVVFLEGGILFVVGGLMDVRESLTVKNLRLLRASGVHSPPPKYDKTSGLWLLLISGLFLCIQSFLIPFVIH